MQLPILVMQRKFESVSTVLWLKNGTTYRASAIEIILMESVSVCVRKQICRLYVQCGIFTGNQVSVKMVFTQADPECSLPQHAKIFSKLAMCPSNDFLTIPLIF